MTQPAPAPATVPAACRWIMHLDMDAFYAAVEQRDHPAWRGRPVVVGAEPGGRGVVATCSYEARRFGVRSAMPINEARRRCPDAVFVRPRMAHYRAVAARIRAVLDAHAPVVEALSIDEAFLDLTGLDLAPPSIDEDVVDLTCPDCRAGSPAMIGQMIGQRLKDAIRAAVGLTASVGIGPNRLVAKLASDFDKPDGLVIVRPDEVLDFLAPLPVGVLRGVGPRTLPLLTRLGLRTIADLRRLSPTALQAALGPRLAASLYQQARGIASDRVGERGPRKSLSKETTFGQDVTDAAVLRETLHALATEVASAAQREGCAGRTVTLKLRFAGFETHTRQRRLAQRSDAAEVLFAAAWDLYAAGTRDGQPAGPLVGPLVGQAIGQWRGRPVRLIGLGIAELGPPEPRQPDLFDAAVPTDPETATGTTSDRDREPRLAAVIAQVQTRFGADALRRGLRHEQPTPAAKAGQPTVPHSD